MKAWLYTRAFRIALGALVGVVIGLTVSAPAHAEDEDDDEADEGALAEARELYEVGNAHYAAGRYEKAAAAFLKGYRLSKLPGFLYNLANAYERMGEYSKAAAKLEIYLKSPKAKDVVSVRERVRRLNAAAEDRKRELRLQKAREEEARKLAKLRGETLPAAAIEYEELPRSPTYLYFLGGGAAMLATGGVFGLVAQSAASSASAGCQGGICSREAKAFLDREKSYALAADISLGIGVALVGVSAYLYLSGPPKRRIDRERDQGGDDAGDDAGDDDDDDDRVGFAPMIGPDGLGIAAVGRF